MKQFSQWLSKRGVPDDAIRLLLTMSETPGIFETPKRIMEPDSWFHFPSNSRFVLLGSCPNGDGIGLDTIDEPGAIFYIDVERVHSDIPDSKRTVRVASSLDQYFKNCLEDPKFPLDYREAKRRP